MVLMMNPSVGLTVLTSSFIIFLTMVVFPALSSPLWWVSVHVKSTRSQGDTNSIKIRISLSFNRAFRKMDNILKRVAGWTLLDAWILVAN